MLDAQCLLLLHMGCQETSLVPGTLPLLRLVDHSLDCSYVARQANLEYFIFSHMFEPAK